MAMGRGKKDEARREPNPEAAERKRLKRMAFSNGILSETPANASLHLNPSNTVLKHLGKDIVKKSQRRNRYLFSFPGLVTPIGRGGKIGDLKDLGTKNPILYINFPQGQMKLFGTILYPKNRYLTLQFCRDGKNAICEDYFDNMIVFSDAWWIGRKDENPEETRLEFPKELCEGQQAEYDFIGGAGVAPVVIQRAGKIKMRHAKNSPETCTENDISDSENNLEDTKEMISVHYSDGTAGKTFADISSGHVCALENHDASVHKQKVVEANTAVNDHNILKEKNPYFLAVDIDNENTLKRSRFLQENRKYASGFQSKKLASSTTASKEVFFGYWGSYVQAFKKEKEQRRSESVRDREAAGEGEKREQRDLWVRGRVRWQGIRTHGDVEESEGQARVQALKELHEVVAARSTARKTVIDEGHNLLVGLMRLVKDKGHSNGIFAGLSLLGKSCLHQEVRNLLVSIGACKLYSDIYGYYG